MQESKARRKVLVVGGGFAGLEVAQQLAGTSLDVVLVDRRNHHTFQPLLYQVALAVLPAGNIASSLRRILRDASNVETLLGDVTGIELERGSVELRGGERLDYDYLIVCAGARHSYFGHDDWEEHAPGLKTIEDAVEIRSRLLLAFETAERRARFTGERETLHFVVVGGGPTGVELAGAIADFARLVLARDFRNIDTARSRILLYEASPRLLGMLSEESSRAAERQLRELGVEVHTDSMVTAIEPSRIQVRGEWFPAHVVLWATGVAASPLGKRLGVPTDRHGRVHVEPDLSLPGRREVFVLGDMSTLVDAAGIRVPGLAAAAKQQGRHAARTILGDLEGRPRQPFRYRDRGTMATIGLHRAVAEIGGRRFSGVVAWALWSLVHVYLLIGFRNRLSVMLEWAWAYFRREGSSPLITQPEGTRPEASEVKQLPPRQR